MCGEIRDTANGITLNFDIRAQHLTDEGFEPSQLDNKYFVIR